MLSIVMDFRAWAVYVERRFLLGKGEERLMHERTGSMMIARNMSLELQREMESAHHLS